MSCKLIFKNNEPIGVEDSQGNQSKLFDSIVSNPHINFNQAVEIYQNIYAEKIKLEGAPTIEGATGADPELTNLAEKYAKENGIPYNRQAKYVEIDEDRAKRIAEEYDKMEHNPSDPKVKEAYQNLIEQVTAQYNILKDAGYKFYFFDETNDPYEGNPWNAMRDLRKNKQMGVFSTEAGFGSGDTEINVEDNPLLADTGITWGDGSVDGEPRKVLANDLFRCFLPNTLIKTKEGFKYIQDIKVGDYVLTHKKRYRRVYETMKNPHKGEILSIETNASYNPIKVTPEHPFYVMIGNHGEQKNSICTPYICDRKQLNGNKTPQNKYHKFDWVEAKDLTTKTWFPLITDNEVIDLDYIVVPEIYKDIRTNLPSRIELDSDMLSFIGLYIAEGSGGTNRININLHVKENNLIDLVRRVSKKLGYETKERIIGNGIVLQINCKILKEWFAEWLGKGAKNKKIPLELLKLPANKLKYLADGIFSGDGKKTHNSIEQTSLTLALQLIEVGKRLGVQPTSNRIFNSLNENHSPTYTTHEFTKKEHNFTQKKYTWNLLEEDCRQITNISKEHYEGYVYNIEVEEDHSYVVENVPTHNCVHDAFGHGLEGSGFRARGEENAWQAHARLFTGSALGALTSETRGQNSWLNYGVHGEKNREAKIEDTIFADQKTGLMPEWTWKEGLDVGAEKEPDLIYKDSEGNTHTSFQEALKATTGDTVSMGIETVNGYKELAAIESNSNIASKEGVINNLVRSNLLSGESFIDTDGSKIFKTKGHSIARKVINSDAVITAIRSRLGIKAVRALSNGDIVFDDNHSKRQLSVTKKDGTTEYITPEELSKKSFKELERDYEDALALVALRDYRAETSIYGEALEPLEPYIPENELQLRLLNVLKTMGVKSTSIADYVTNFSIKNGVEPSAQALADLANNVIAFKNGEVNADDLLEESAHFIIAQTPEAEKADLKRNIHKTPEWIEHQASYREIYGQTYSGEELEDIVREEILGKVLKNAVNDRFRAETESQQNFYNKVLDFFKSFFTKVENYFSSESQKQLDKYTNAVYTNLMNDTLSGMLSGENNRHYTLYSTTANTNGEVSKVYKQAEELLNRLTQQQKELSKEYNLASSKSLISNARKKLENLEGEIEEVARLKAIANLAMVANSQASVLKRAVENKINKGSNFSQEEHSVYQNMVHKIEPLLLQVNDQLSSKSNNEKKVKSDIEATLETLKFLKTKAETINEKALDTILDRIIKKNSFTDTEAAKYREDIKKILSVAQKDTQFLHANLGSLTNAKNGFLNLAGEVIERTQNTERSLFLPEIKDFLNSFDKLGFNTATLKKFIKNGHIINEVDAKKVEQEDLKDKVDSYNDNYKGTEAATKENIETKLKELDSEIKELEGSKADKQKLAELTNFKQKYNNSYKQRTKDRWETYFSDDYLKQMEDTTVTTDLGVISRDMIAPAAIEAEKHYRSQTTDIKLSAENGILTASDADAIKEINKQKLEDSFPRDSEGKLKKGLIEYFDNTLGKFLVKIDSNASLSDSEQFEADKIVGLQNISLLNQEFYKDKLKSDKSNKFIEELNKLKTEKEKWDFVQLNSYLGFDDAFWATFSTEGSLIDRLRVEGYDVLVEDIRSQQQIISNILKKNRVFNNPSETDANHMSLLDMESINRAQSVLENKYNTARGLLQDIEEQTEREIKAESVTNEAYKQRLEDESITSVDEEVDFILKHVTLNNSSYISSAKKIAAALKDGIDVKLNKTFSQVFNENMTEEEIDEALITYAKSKLLPYYKRTEPIGYSAKLEQFKKDIEDNKEGTVEALVNGNSYISDDLKISPNFSFFETTEGINKQWLANRDAKRTQYSKKWLDRVRDDEYHKMFGIDSKTRERVGNTNQKDWEARERLLALQDETLSNYGISGTHDRYLLPQFQKNSIERGVKGIKKSLSELVGFRADELEYGQDINGVMSKKGSTLLTIPMYGVNKIEDQGDVSEQLLHSYATMFQQSCLYRARRENIGDMLVLNNLILGTDYENKEAATTNTYKMFKSYMDANYYGVKESFSYETKVLGKKIDLAKVAHTFNSYVKTSALAGFTVPLTSLVTGRVAGFVETMVGEAVNPMAYKKAHIEFAKHASAAAAEIGGFTSHAKLNVVLEAIGIYNTSERFQNSNYNKALRTGLKGSSGLNELGNFPVSAPLSLGVIYDYKYYGNDIITFDQFKQRNSTKSISQVKEDWEKLDQFYDDWAAKDGVLVIDTAKMAKKLGVSTEEAEELKKLKLEAISARAASLLARTDARVPEHQRSVWARDARTNFMLTFLNYLCINTSLKVKSRHYNISEQRYQEGNWNTVLTLMNDMLMKPKDMKKVWNDALADDVKRINLKRTAIELGVANALAIAAILLANYADDEEDPSFLLQYSSFMLDRLAVEQASGTIGLPNQFGDVINNPILAIQKAKDLKDIGDVFSGDLVQRSPQYVGQTERQKFFSKNIAFVKEYARMKDAKRARQTYQHFNFGTLDNWAWGSWFFDIENKY